MQLTDLQCSSLSITYLCESSDCVTAAGTSWRLLFGAGVKLITEASEYLNNSNNI